MICVETGSNTEDKEYLLVETAFMISQRLISSVRVIGIWLVYKEITLDRSRYTE